MSLKLNLQAGNYCTTLPTLASGNSSAGKRRWTVWFYAEERLWGAKEATARVEWRSSNTCLTSAANGSSVKQTICTAQPVRSRAGTSVCVCARNEKRSFPTLAPSESEEVNKYCVSPAGLSGFKLSWWTIHDICIIHTRAATQAKRSLPGGANNKLEVSVSALYCHTLLD